MIFHHSITAPAGRFATQELTYTVVLQTTMKFATMIPLAFAAQNARAFVVPTGPLTFGAVRRVASCTPLAMAAAKEETGEV